MTMDGGERDRLHRRVVWKGVFRHSLRNAYLAGSLAVVIKMSRIERI